MTTSAPEFHSAGAEACRERRWISDGLFQRLWTISQKKRLTGEG